ncbi:MAG: VanZ family protein [Endomicrobiales bacterium]
MNKKHISLWLPPIAWCSVIYYLSSLPNLATSLGFWDLVLRKTAHMVEYGVLLLLVLRAFAGSFPRTPAPAIHFWAIVVSILYAASDEFHQSFVPTRGPSPADVGIDIAGVFLGLAVLLLYRKRKQGRTLRTE